MDKTFLENAHKHSFQNREEIEKSKNAGCFYCKEIYPASEISEWIADKQGDTAQCPKCVIDSVIGDASGIEITKEFLEAAHEYWFERTTTIPDVL